MKRFYSIILISLAALIPAGAVTVNLSEAGTLKSLIDNPSSVTELTLTGTADATDFNFIATSMPALSTLDLGGVTIAASTGTKINGISNFKANEIPTGAFAGMAISSVTFPATAGLRIGDMAFESTALETVVIPNNISVIGTGAFSDCRNLKSVTLNSRTALETHVFSNCPSLASAKLNSATTLPASTFEGDAALEIIEGGECITTIGEKALSGCSALKSYDFSETLKAIETQAFAGTALTNVNLSICDNLTTIGDYAFAGCTEITDATLGSSVRQLGKGCFMGCENLATITLPASFDTIGDYAMARCLALSTIEASDLERVPETGSDVWRGVDQGAATLQVADEAYDDFVNAPQWQEFQVKSPNHTDIVDKPFTDTNESRLSAHFDGYTLNVNSYLNRRVSLYTLDGRLLASTDTDGSDCRLTFDTGASDNQVFIIVAEGNNGSRKALKIIRK